MNLRYSELKQWTVKTTDGQERPIADFLLDGQGWRVRYAVIDTGGWLHNRQILISPSAFGTPDPMGRVIPLNATIAQMELSPPLEAHLPVTLAHERALEEHYEWPSREAEGNVLSAGAIKHMKAVTREGEWASIDDIVFRDNPWQIEAWMVDARPWMPGGQVTLNPGAVASVNVNDGVANLTLERTELEGLSAAQDNLAHTKK